MDKLCLCSLTRLRCLFLRLVLVLGLSFSGSVFAQGILYRFTVSGVTTDYATFAVGARASCSATYPDDGSGWICPSATCGVRNTGGAAVPTNIGGAGQAQCFALQEYPTGVWNPTYQTWVNAGGFTVVGGACPSGYTENPVTHLCEAVVPCPAAGTNAIPSGQIGYGESAEGSNPINAVLCGANQCGITIQQATGIPIGGGQQGNYIQQAVYTGNKVTGVCPLMVVAPSPKEPTLPKPIDTVTPDANTPDGVPQKGEDCPPGSAFGQVNGVNVCSPSGSKIAYAPETTTQTNNGQTTTSTVNKTAEVMPDGSIKTTSTVSTSSGGVGSVTTTTKNSGGPSGMNGRDGKDGEGIDGVDLGPAPSAESENPGNFLPGAGPGQDGAGQGARTFAIQPKITGGSTACLADRSVSAMGVTVTIPLSALCPWFEVMYNLVSIFAVFSALRILVMS